MPKLASPKPPIQSPRTARFRQHHRDKNEKEGKKTPHSCVATKETNASIVDGLIRARNLRPDDGKGIKHEVFIQKKHQGMVGGEPNCRVDGRQKRIKTQGKSRWCKVCCGCVVWRNLKVSQSISVGGEGIIKKKKTSHTAESPYPPASRSPVVACCACCARWAKAAKRRTTSASTLSHKRDRV